MAAEPRFDSYEAVVVASADPGHTAGVAFGIGKWDVLRIDDAKARRRGVTFWVRR